MTQPIINVNINIAAPIEDPNTVRVPFTCRGEIKYFLVDREDFDRVNEHKWYLNIHGYMRLRGGGGVLHRYVLDITDPKIEVDHVNGDKLDNRKSNLRVVTHVQNCQNTKKSATNKSGFKGVSFHKALNEWRADIRVDGKTKYLGCYSTPEVAARAYDEAARIHFGEYGRYNFPREGERSAI